MSARIAGSDYDTVAKFVDDGGVLIRFAGERMTGGADDLVPVKLRVGGRYLGGALAWAEPQHLAPFPETSPFSGLAIPGEVTVSRQILAEPSVELSDRTWARLADGTPLVTARAARQGLDRAVPHHRQPGLVVAAAVGTLCRHAAAAAGAVERHAAERHGER